VHLAPEDPRYTDLQREVLAKLARALPHVTIRLASGRHTLTSSAGDEAYGEVEYAYGAHVATSRSTSPREILPLLYDLARVPVPTAMASDAYPGYPCVADAQAALLWFCGGLPLMIGLTWWWTRRPPYIDRSVCMQEVTHADRCTGDLPAPGARSPPAVALAVPAPPDRQRERSCADPP